MPDGAHRVLSRGSRVSRGMVARCLGLGRKTGPENGEVRRRGAGRSTRIIEDEFPSVRRPGGIRGCRRFGRKDGGELRGGC